METIETKCNAWGEPDAPLHCLSDFECAQIIEEPEPKLKEIYEEEENGMVKADIYTKAVLYMHEG